MVKACDLEQAELRIALALLSKWQAVVRQHGFRDGTNLFFEIVLIVDRTLAMALDVRRLPSS